jgi:hypothetical protein
MGFSLETFKFHDQLHCVVLGGMLNNSHQTLFGALTRLIFGTLHGFILFCAVLCHPPIKTWLTKNK